MLLGLLLMIAAGILIRIIVFMSVSSGKDTIQKWADYELKRRLKL